MSYVTFADPVFADICALWVIGTHAHDRFDAYGYLVITAATKRAGKSVLAELMSFVARDGKMGTSMTASVLRRLVARGCTLFFDEAESLNSESASAVREYLNVGYRAGQMVFMPGEGPDAVIEYPAYSPKCFILIGDVSDTLRDRAITIEMRRATPPRIYRRSEAAREGAAIQGKRSVVNEDTGATATALTDVIQDATSLDTLTYDEAWDFLDARSAELWAPVFALARVFAPSRLSAIVKTAADLDSLKQTTEGRRFSKLRKDAETDTTGETFGAYAMRDLAAALGDERSVFTEVAIQRMKAIPTSPWRTYKGNGLTPVMLSDMLSTFGVVSKYVKIKGVTKRGFQRADVIAGTKQLGKEKE